MNIRFMKRCDEDREDEYLSFWMGTEIRYDFELTYDDKKENVKLFEKELKLNLENQFDLENIHGK